MPRDLYGRDYGLVIAAVLLYTITCRSRQRGAPACGQAAAILALPPPLPENSPPPPCLRGPRLTPIILSYNCVGRRGAAGEQAAASHPLCWPLPRPTPSWTEPARTHARGPRGKVDVQFILISIKCRDIFFISCYLFLWKFIYCICLPQYIYL